ncbi:MAG: threonine/serine exporter family protein, partial [Bacteroidota bacterium]
MDCSPFDRSLGTAYNRLPQRPNMECASGSATTLFFGGDFRDGGWGFLMGIIAFLISKAASNFKGLSEIECFITAIVISAVSALADRFIYDDGLCLYGIMFGGVCWLLPGI